MRRRNAITDVPGLRVGHAHSARLRSGATVILPDGPARAAADIRGGGPGTRETETMAESGLVNEVHALVLSGGSAFGLDAATGVQSLLRERGVGFAVGPALVPIVPQAILFDLANGGDKEWGRHPPYRDMAYDAAGAASPSFALGSAGAGYGATVAWAAMPSRSRLIPCWKWSYASLTAGACPVMRLVAGAAWASARRGRKERR